MKRLFFCTAISILTILCWLEVQFPTGCVTAQEHLSLTLNESIDIALKNSKMLHSSKAKLISAKAKVGEVRAGFLPKFTLTGRYTRLSEVKSGFEIEGPAMPDSIPRVPIAGNPSFYDEMLYTMLREFITGLSSGMSFETFTNNYDIQFSVQQPLFTGFRLINSYELSKYSQKSAEMEFDKDVAETIFNVKSAYYGLMKAREFEKVSAEAVNLVNAHLTDLRNMYAVGIVAKNDLLKAEVQLSNVQLMQIKAKNVARLAEIAFCNALDIPLDTKITIKDTLDYEPEPIDDLSVVLDNAFENRPELKAMKYTLEMGKKGVSLAKGGWYPSIAIVGNYNYSKPNARIFPQENKWKSTWDVSLVAQLTIWDWGVTHYQTSQAKANLYQVEDGLSQLKNGITLQVTQAYWEVKEAEEKIAVSKKGVEQAEENYRVTNEKFKNGAATNTELLDAENALTQAKTDYIQSLADYRISRAKLEKAVGKGAVIGSR